MWLPFALTVMLALLAVSYLVLSVIHSRYDDQLNRDPVLRIAAAAVTSLIAACAAWECSGLLWSRGRARPSTTVVIALTVLSVILTLGTWVIDIATGPH